MLSDAQRYLYRTVWPPPLLPGPVIVLMCLAVNLAGDALRDALDPATGALRHHDRGVLWTASNPRGVQGYAVGR